MSDNLNDFIDDSGADDFPNEDHGGLIGGGPDGNGGPGPSSSSSSSTNPFVDALDRIAASKRKGRAALNMKPQEAKSQAKRLVKEMIRIYSADYMKILNNEPATEKAQNMSNIVKSINRKGFGEYFLQEGGLDQLVYFIHPVEEDRIDVDRRAPANDVVKGVLDCLKYLEGCLTSQRISRPHPDLKVTIGKIVRNIMKDPLQPRSIRLQAQGLVQDWVSMVVQNKRTAGSAFSQEEEERRKDQGLSVGEIGNEEEAEEVDERGRKVRKLNSHGQVDVNPFNFNAVKKTEAELNAIWTPSVEQQQEFDKRLELRHAMMPLEKPTFSAEALPQSLAPPKRKFKEDPNTSVGKIGQQLAKITNPNKHIWKSQVDQVSISGRGIQYNW